MTHTNFSSEKFATSALREERSAKSVRPENLFGSREDSLSQGSIRPSEWLSHCTRRYYTKLVLMRVGEARARNARLAIPFLTSWKLEDAASYSFGH